MEKEQQSAKMLDTKAKIEKYFGRLDEASDDRIIQWLCDEYGLTEEEVKNTHVYILKTDIIFKFIADCKLTKRDYHLMHFLLVIELMLLLIVSLNIKIIQNLRTKSFRFKDNLAYIL